MPYKIEEVIVPSELSIPDSHNAFSVIPGGMPNGDDCIRVDSTSLSGNVSAWQTFPLYSTLFSGGAAKAFLCWIRLHSGGVSSSGWGVNTTVAGGYVAGGNEAIITARNPSDTGTTRTLLSIMGYTDACGVVMTGTSSYNQRFKGSKAETMTDGEWRMIGCSQTSHTTSPVMKSYVNLSVIPTQTGPIGDFSGGGGALSTSTMHFGIGNINPSGAGPFRCPPGVWDIGPMHWFNYVPTDDDFADLYNAMTG